MSQPLVSASWLKDALTSGAGPDIRVIDVSFPMPGEKIDMAEEYKKKHIAGATFFSLFKVKDSESKFALMLPTPEIFAEHVGKVHGVSNSTHVIVYDRNVKFGLFSSCRLWWMLRVFGHTNVSVLDGGLEEWFRVGGATADGESPSVEAGTFVPAYQEQLVRGFSDVSSALASGTVQVLDARNPPRFNGQAPEPNPKLPSGHMAGATNVPFFKLLQSDSKTFKSEADLREVYSSLGIDLSKPTMMTCGSGVTACVLAFSAFQLGHQSIPVFDGSWTEFVQRASPDQVESLLFPLET